MTVVVDLTSGSTFFGSSFFFGTPSSFSTRCRVWAVSPRSFGSGLASTLGSGLVRPGSGLGSAWEPRAARVNSGAIPSSTTTASGCLDCHRRPKQGRKQCDVNQRRKHRSRCTPGCAQTARRIRGRRLHGRSYPRDACLLQFVHDLEDRVVAHVLVARDDHGLVGVARLLSRSAATSRPWTRSAPAPGRRRHPCVRAAPAMCRPG